MIKANDAFETMDKNNNFNSVLLKGLSSSVLLLLYWKILKISSKQDIISKEVSPYVTNYQKFKQYALAYNTRKMDKYDRYRNKALVLILYLYSFCIVAMDDILSSLSLCLV